MNILAIGGSDPSSGAGIQSDILASRELGANCFSVITAITAQNSKEFIHAEDVSVKSIQLQIESIFSDFDLSVITIGMVHNIPIIKAVHSKLKKIKTPIVIDPVIKSTTGGILLKKDAIIAFKKLLVPLCHTITPNLSEAEIISGLKIRKFSDLILAAKEIQSLGAKNVIITGHSFDRGQISDFVFDGTRYESIAGKKIPGRNHGSGCNFAIALSVSIARKKNVFEAARFAKIFTYEAIKNSKQIGGGIKITKPHLDKIHLELEESIKKFEELEQIQNHIPECQTNFVFAKKSSKTIEDVLGVSGRIVKAGKQAIVAGNLEYGGSKHVANAVITIRKKFPTIRSAINIKYSEATIKEFAKLKFKISSYNRFKEPKSLRTKENSSIVWGINQAIENLSTPPDLIFHKGDFGKEPMILIFGTSPSDVLEKLKKII